MTDCCFVRRLRQAPCLLCAKANIATTGLLYCIACHHVTHAECAKQLLPIYTHNQFRADVLAMGDAERQELLVDNYAKDFQLLQDRYIAQLWQSLQDRQFLFPLASDLSLTEQAQKRHVLLEAARTVVQGSARADDPSYQWMCWTCRWPQTFRWSDEIRQRRIQPVEPWRWDPLLRRDPHLQQLQATHTVRSRDIVRCHVESDTMDCSESNPEEAVRQNVFRDTEDETQSTWQVWWMGVPIPYRATRLENALVSAMKRPGGLCSCHISLLVPVDVKTNKDIMYGYNGFQSHWPWVVFDLDMVAHEISSTILERWCCMPTARYLRRRAAPLGNWEFAANANADPNEQFQQFQQTEVAEHRVVPLTCPTLYIRLLQQQSRKRTDTRRNALNLQQRCIEEAAAYSRLPVQMVERAFGVTLSDS